MTILPAASGGWKCAAALHATPQVFAERVFVIPSHSDASFYHSLHFTMCQNPADLYFEVVCQSDLCRSP